MDSVYRRIGSEDFEQLSKLYSDVYIYGIDDARRDVQHDLGSEQGTEGLAAFVGGRMASALEVIDYTIYLGSDKVAMGGIAGVATHAEDRRKHLVAGLLKMTLEHMREKGVQTSVLYPFSRSFYRKFGWEHACDALQFKAKVKDLHTLRDGRGTSAERCEFVRVDSGSVDNMDLSALETLYPAYFSDYNCAAVRGPREWGRFRRQIAKSVAAGRSNYVYAGIRGSRPVCYFACAFRKNPDDSRNLWIREAAAVDGAAWADILGFIARHDAQAVDVEGTVPFDSPLRTLLSEPGKMEVAPHLMFRVVDVARLLEAVAADGLTDGFFTLGVRDRTCEWNNQVFAVSIESGKVSAAPALHADSDLGLDISTLSQIISGYASAASLARAGLVQVSDARALEMLRKIFPVRRTFCADYF